LFLVQLDHGNFRCRARGQLASCANVRFRPIADIRDVRQVTSMARATHSPWFAFIVAVLLIFLLA
jgi:hypothetical protein